MQTDSNEFQLILSSDSSLDSHPKNSPEKFINRLPYRLNLSKEDRWGVTCQEIIYPKTYIPITEIKYCFTTQNKEISQHFSFVLESYNSYHEYIEKFLKDVQANYNMSVGSSIISERKRIDDLTSKINTWTLYEQDKHNIRRAFYEESSDTLLYMHSTSKSEFKIMTNKFEGKTVLLKILEDKENLIGLQPIVIADYLGETQTGYYKKNIQKFNNILFINTDIIEPIICGDLTANVLRIFPINNTATYGQHIKNSFGNKQYRKVSGTNIDQIEIHITNDQGQLLSFDSGTCYVTLQFKKNAY